jgi:hypothetical protein
MAHQAYPSMRQPHQQTQVLDIVFSQAPQAERMSAQNSLPVVALDD